LRQDELSAAYRALAASFDEDPLFVFLLPEPDKRRRWLEVIMAASLRMAMPYGVTLTPSRAPGTAAIALIPPGNSPGAAAMLRQVFRRRPSMPWPSWRLLRSGFGALNVIGKLHIKGLHYYVQTIGVDPERKGQGLGGELMRHTCQLSDREQVPTYLETSNEVNLGFYRRYGFEVREQVGTPGGGPPIWTMLREPGLRVVND
jgi:ribosomal protein S18 acetylase RimI-like enzyme